MNGVILSLKKLVQFIGEKSAWLNVVLVLLICIDVMQRYMFNQSFNWVMEMEWHLFGIIFLLCSAYTLQLDKHVRVDVFYNNFGDKTKAWVDVICTSFLLVPFCVVGIKTCYKYASNSYDIREGSPNPGGLPALYIIKFCIVFAFVLMLVQALIMVVQNIKVIRK